MENTYKEIIKALSEEQVTDFIEVIGNYIRLKNNLSTEGLRESSIDLIHSSNRYEEMRAILLIIASLPNHIGEYLRGQLYSNEAFLAEERNSGDSRGVEATELIPFLMMTLTLLKGQINFSIRDGKIDFSINIGLISPLALIASLRENQFSVPDASDDTDVAVLEGKIADTIHKGNSTHTPDKTAAIQEIKLLIAHSKIDDAISLAMNTFSEDAETNISLVMISRELQDLKTKQQRGVLSVADESLLTNQILLRLLSVIG